MYGAIEPMASLGVVEHAAAVVPRRDPSPNLSPFRGEGTSGGGVRSERLGQAQGPQAHLRKSVV